MSLIDPTRDRAPVFIVGSARSGTTLLYHLLLSSGVFANYRGEPAVFDLIRPRFGDLAHRRNREALMNAWLRSAMYRISGLDAQKIHNQVLNECDSAGVFLRLVMSEVARVQGKERWAVWGPDNLLFMEQIKKELPDALFIHMIRDGRDVAVSMTRERWIETLPWDRTQNLVVAGLHWQWKVARGIQSAKTLSPDYLEIHFEELLTHRRNIMTKISDFLGQELDFDQMVSQPLGSVLDPNTSFQEERSDGTFQPIERWRRVLSAAQLEALESAIGALLKDLGYEVVGERKNGLDFRHQIMQQLYPRYFDFKQWLKVNTILGNLVSIERMHLSDSPH